MTSFVICSIDASKLEAVSHSIAQRMQNHAHEIVAIRDAKSLADGYMRGAAMAKGERLVFCHDDIEILTPDFAERLDRHLRDFDMIGVAGADRVIGSLWSLAAPPHLFGQIAHLHAPSQQYDVSIFCNARPVIDGIRVLDGLFIAIRREVLDRVRFDAATFDGWHLYDMDFSFSAYLAGLKLAVCSDIQLLHFSPGMTGPRWAHYAQLFNRKHLAHLDAMPQRAFAISQVRVRTKQEALAVMSPRFWDLPRNS